MSLTITAPAAPSKYLHGVNMRLLIGVGDAVQAFKVSQIDFDHECDMENITNSESGGWDELLEGVQRASMEITFPYDLANSPMVSPQQLRASKTATLHMIVDANTSAGLPTATSTSDWTGQVKIQRMKFPTGPKAGPVNVVCSAKSSGPFTIPAV